MLYIKMFSRLFSCHKNPIPEKKYLSNDIQWNDTLQFIPPINTGRVIKVYDADTFIVAAHLPYDSSPLYRFTVRLNGIDYTEIKYGNDTIHAKDELENLILNKMITLKNIKNEKYGRILADIYIDNLHINQYMIDEQLMPPRITVKDSKTWFKLCKCIKNNETIV
jgi:endonuclease YncB( thermonuclease family)